MPPGPATPTGAERVLAARKAYFEAGNAVIERAGGRFVCNRTNPSVYDANHVWADGSADAAALLDALAEVQPWTSHRQVRVTGAVDGPLAAQLAVADFVLSTEIDLLLPASADVPAGRVPDGLAVRPVDSPADATALTALARADHVEAAADDGREVWPEAVTEQMVAVRLGKAPSLRYWLAAVDGVDVGCFSSFVPDGAAATVALVEDLYTDPAWRGRGVARALVHHCVADARRRGAGEVAIGGVPGDWPKGWYASLGFAPVGVRHTYDRDLPDHAA